MVNMISQVIDRKRIQQYVDPVCPVFEKCGGCLYQDIAYDDELKIKENLIRRLFNDSLNISEHTFSTIVPSPKPYHYRNRLDIRLKRTDEGGILIGFTPSDSKGVISVDACYIADNAISDFIPTMKRQAVARLPKKYRNANLTVRTGEDKNVRWGGIGKGSCALPMQDYFWTDINGKRIHYSLDTFFQSNLSILPALIGKIRSFPVWTSKPLFLDLYGGVGLFGIALSDMAGRVVLIEENVHSLKVARHNIEVNAIGNIMILDGKVEDHLVHQIDEPLNCPIVAMVDPPRAGLSPEVRRLLTEAAHLDEILYLSCQPESLIRDLKVLTASRWRIREVIPFDFFPKTKHIETLVYLSSKGV